MNNLKTKDVVVNVADYNGYDLPDKLEDILKFFKDAAMAVPLEYRDTVRFEIETFDNYGSPESYLNVTYTRPETADESKKRVESAMHYKNSELQQLKALKEKYPDEV